MDTDLQYDFQSFILTNGNLADKLRLISTGYGDSTKQREQVISDLEMKLNSDGGVPFGFKPTGPSSVKETAEMLSLVSTYRNTYSSLVDKLASFLVSRQKKDGGFSETLNLDPHIEDKWGTMGGRDWYPVGKSITWLTGKALEALALIEYPDRERLLRARDFLMYSQNEDGHWPDFKGQNESDPLATGNILQGLQAIGVDSDHKVYIDARAALLQHLKECVETKSTSDMADLPAIGKPKSDLEKKVLQDGLKLIVESQNKDGGWAPFGTKKSDPELSSILVVVLNKCSKLC